MNTFTRAILTLILPITAQANCYDRCQRQYDSSIMNVQFASDVGAIVYGDVKVLRTAAFLKYSECTDSCELEADQAKDSDAEIQKMFQDTYKAIEELKTGHKQP